MERLNLNIISVKLLLLKMHSFMFGCFKFNLLIHNIHVLHGPYQHGICYPYASTIHHYGGSRVPFQTSITWMEAQWCLITQSQQAYETDTQLAVSGHWESHEFQMTHCCDKEVPDIQTLEGYGYGIPSAV